MKKGYLYFVAFITIAALTQWALIKYMPNLVHAIAIHRVKKTNQWINNGPTDASMRTVVMPNPDFVYSALFYDVSEHDIQISGTLPDSVYASLSFYDDRCQPYAVYNNLTPHHSGQFSIVISRDGIKGANGVKAQTAQGEILCRYLLKGDSAYVKTRALQAQLACVLK
jgi:uncharacterized membrane protein